MKVHKNTVVSFVYTLSDLSGNIVENGDAPVQYLHGGYGDILPKIEAALEGASVGSEITLHLDSSEAFGEYDASLVKLEQLTNLPNNAYVGMEIEPIEEEEAGDDDDAVVFTITNIAEGQAVLDGNHPFAGQAMRLVAGVVGVRAASPEEIQNQYPNSDGDDDDDLSTSLKNSDHFRSHRLN